MLGVFAFSSVAVLFQLICLVIGGVHISTALLGIVVLANLTVLQAGVLMMARFRLSLKAGLPAAYVAGYAVVSSALMVLITLLGVSPAVALFILAGATIATTFVLGIPAIDDMREDLGLCFGIAVALVALSASSTASPVALETLGTLPAWYDVYLHGMTIHALGSPFAPGGDIELIGASLIFYHYAPFALPAVLSEATGLDGLSLATSYLMPFGLWVGALGLYSFCCQLGGRAAAVCTFALFVLIPGPSEYIIDSGWLDITWLLFASPGAGYAIGLCFLAATLVHEAQRQSRWPLFVLAAALLLLVIFQRVHFFMLAAPALLAVGLLSTPPRLRNFIISGTCITVVVATALLFMFPEIRGAWIGFSRPFEYLDITLRWSEDYIDDVEPYLGTGFLGRTGQLLVNLLASTGIFLVIAPVVAALKIRRFGFTPMDSLPLMLALTYLFLILFMPPGGNGDISEYKHRHVIFLYAAFVALPAIWAVQLGRARRVALVSTGLGIAAVLVSLSFYGKPIDAPNGKAMPWSAEYHDRPVTAGVPQTAHFVSRASRAGDVMAVDAQTADKRLGPLTEFLGLSPVPAYLSRGELKALRSECHAAVVAERLAVLREVDTAATWAAALEVLQNHGLRWYVRFDGPAAWDTNGEADVFTSNTVVVYDAQSAPLPVEDWKICGP